MLAGDTGSAFHWNSGNVIRNYRESTESSSRYAFSLQNKFKAFSLTFMFYFIVDLVEGAFAIIGKNI